MTYLIDTHVLLWAVSEPERLSREVADVLSTDPGVVVSDVSLWELSIKAGIGKLTLLGGQTAGWWFEEHCTRLRLQSLSITRHHLAHVQFLPTHHRDPFDRLLIAQAVVEGHTLITADSTFDAYDVRVLRA